MSDEEGSAGERGRTDGTTGSGGSGGGGDGGQRRGGDGRSETQARGQALEERAKRLDQKESELEERERQLNKRARELEERESDVLERREETVELREELDEQEERLEKWETQLDERATGLEDRETELARRADEIETREETLDEYAGGDTFTRRPRVAGGVLLMLVGAVELLGGVGLAAYVLQSGVQVSVVSETVALGVGAGLAVKALVELLGGLSAWRGKRWLLAIAGAIFSIVPLFPVGVMAAVLLAVGESQFD